MSAHQITATRGLMDIIMKGMMTVALPVIGWFVNDLHSEMKRLSDNDQAKSERIVILETKGDYLIKRLDSIDTKLDKIWEVAKAAR